MGGSRGTWRGTARLEVFAVAILDLLEEIGDSLLRSVGLAIEVLVVTNDRVADEREAPAAGGVLVDHPRCEQSGVVAEGISATYEVLALCLGVDGEVQVACL